MAASAFIHPMGVKTSSIAMALGMAIIVGGMVVMILDRLPAAEGELVFFAGLAILLAGAIAAIRRD